MKWTKWNILKWTKCILNNFTTQWKSHFKVYHSHTHPFTQWRLFHFLSLLFVDLCACVQNNQLHDVVLLRGNAATGQWEEVMFFTCYHAEQLCDNREVIPSSSFVGSLSIWHRKPPSLMACVERNNKIMFDLVRQPGNTFCADCGVPGEYADKDS